MGHHAHNHPHADQSRRSNLALTELTARLRRGSRKLTGQRQAILDLLRQHSHPLSIRNIFDALATGGCNLATVYRSVHLLETMGMVKRYEFGDGVARYELLAEGDDGHHHHLICTRCARVIELEHCSFDVLEQEIARRHGFRRVTHKLEFFGLCPACST